MEANDLRKKAHECRKLAHDAVAEEVAYQLRLWAEADAISRNECSGPDTEHTTRDASCPAARSGSAASCYRPAAADTNSQS